MGGFLAWLKSLFSPPRVTRIKVKINFGKDGSCWNYDLEADDKDSEPFVKPGNKIDFPHGQPTSVIEFRLQGKAGQKLDFDLNCMGGPIWVKANNCPTQPNSVPGEITVLNSSTVNRLDVENKNLIAGDFYYRLNFLDDQNKPTSWDPVIRNGGGGGP